jgi:hypothetical protein
VQAAEGRPDGIEQILNNTFLERIFDAYERLVCAKICNSTAKNLGHSGWQRRRLVFSYTRKSDRFQSLSFWMRATIQMANWLLRLPQQSRRFGLSTSSSMQALMHAVDGGVVRRHARGEDCSGTANPLLTIHKLTSRDTVSSLKVLCTLG